MRRRADIIDVIRGDSLLIPINKPVPLFKGMLLYDVKEGDEISFKFQDECHRRHYEEIRYNALTTEYIELTPADTRKMDYHTYTYSIQLRTKQGFSHTFMTGTICVEGEC